VGSKRRSWDMTATNVAPGQARRAVRDYVTLLDLPAQLVDDVLLCVSEAVTNVAKHAYADAGEPGVLEVDASFDDDLRICVRDHGSGFVPRVEGEGPGLGLPIISRLTRSFHVRTMSSGGTEVVMRFALGGERSADAPAQP
jgi:anti-sigma regulatory factor (Ser/Thr protein kinase)